MSGVGKSPDGNFTFHMDSNHRDMFCEITERGAAAGLTEEMIEGTCHEYLASEHHGIQHTSIDEMLAARSRPN